VTNKTHSEPPNQKAPITTDKVDAEPLALRARPRPIKRIDRKVLIGGAAVVLAVIASLVLLALKPPSLRHNSGQDHYSVDRKPITDRLAGLPASYESVGARKSAPVDPPLEPGVKQLQQPSIDPGVEAERSEKTRLARLSRQAREAPVFFRLQAKTPPGAPSAPDRRAEHAAQPPRAPPNSELASLTALRASDSARAGVTTNPQPSDSADQSGKLAFLTSRPEKEIYNPHAVQTPVSPYQVMAGTIIAASLISGLNSDLPGFVIAQVTENVFDSVTGRFLLIPQGARLIGKYDTVVAFGQNRALVVWQRIILPDGASVVIDNLPATDTGGYTGVADAIDLHTWQLVKGIALATVLGVGSSVAFGSTDSDLMKALRESTGQTTNRAGQRLVEKNLAVQPTLTVRPGWPLRVIVHKDIVFR
jgi:type IV secretion system protein TrbI